MQDLVPYRGDGYPVRFEAEYPDRLSRLSTFFRLILAIPLAIVAGILGGSWNVWGPGFAFGFGLMSAFVVVHWITVIVRGRPVPWVFDTIVSIQRFVLRAQTYFLLMTDRYPPFDGEWTVHYEVDRPQRLSRWKLLFWKTITSIPHLVALAVVSILVFVVVFISWFAILFTGRYPKGLHDFVEGWIRWSARVGAYWMSLTGEWPAFGFSADVGRGQVSSYAISAVAGGLIFAASVAGITAVAAWPPDMTEVRVSYEDAVNGRPSAYAEVAGADVRLLEIIDPYDFSDNLLASHEGRRFVLVHLEFFNRTGHAVTIAAGNFRLKDASGDNRRPEFVSISGEQAPVRVDKLARTEIAAVFEVDGGELPVELTYGPSFGFKERLKFILE